MSAASGDDKLLNNRVVLGKRWELKGSLLGEGNTGKVYKAKDLTATPPIPLACKKIRRRKEISSGVDGCDDAQQAASHHSSLSSTSSILEEVIDQDHLKLVENLLSTKLAPDDTSPVSNNAHFPPSSSVLPIKWLKNDKNFFIFTPRCDGDLSNRELTEPLRENHQLCKFYFKQLLCGLKHHKDGASLVHLNLQPKKILIQQCSYRRGESIGGRSTYAEAMTTRSAVLKLNDFLSPRFFRAVATTKNALSSAPIEPSASVLSQQIWESFIKAAAGSNGGLYTAPEVVLDLQKLCGKGSGESEAKIPVSVMTTSTTTVGSYCSSELPSMWSAGCILYEWLVGQEEQPLFSTTSSGSVKSSDNFMQQVLDGSHLDQVRRVVQASHGNEDQFGGGVVALLCGLLQVDPSKRFSVEQALEHPWLNSSSASCEELNGTDVGAAACSTPTTSTAGGPVVVSRPDPLFGEQQLTNLTQRQQEAKIAVLQNQLLSAQMQILRQKDKAEENDKEIEQLKEMMERDKTAMNHLKSELEQNNQSLQVTQGELLKIKDDHLKLESELSIAVRERDTEATKAKDQVEKTEEALSKLQRENADKLKIKRKQAELADLVAEKDRKAAQDESKISKMSEQLHENERKTLELETRGRKQEEEHLKLKGELSTKEKEMEQKLTIKEKEMDYKLNLEAIRICAQEFARGRNFPNPLINPVVLTGPAGQQFAAALRSLGYSSIRDLLNNPTHYLVGFHGTPDANAIAGIFIHNFDPKRRSGQVYGPGEYFDIDKGNIATSYSRATKCPVVAIIVVKDAKGADVKEVSFHDYHNHEKIAVVNNTLDGSGPSAAVEVKWSSIDPRNSKEVEYSAADSALLEAAYTYTSSLSRPNSNSAATSAVVNLTIGANSFSVDVDKMIQTNMSGGSRSVKRETKLHALNLPCAVASSQAIQVQLKSELETKFRKEYKELEKFLS